MGKKDKLKERLLSKPKDFTNEEAETLLIQLGYIKDNKGKTSGSRKAYFHPESKAIFQLHTSHPGNELKMYVVKELIAHLKERGLI